MSTIGSICDDHMIKYEETTSDSDPGELPGFWGSMVFRYAAIPRKGSGN